MASRELNILITAKNLASAAIKGVTGDMKRLEKIGYTAGKGIRTAGQNIGKGAVIAAGAIAYNVKAGVDSLVELNRVEGLTQAALKSTGSAAAGSAVDIRKRAEALENLTTVDDKAIQNAENLLLTFRGIGKQAFDPTLKAALNLNAAMGGDQNSLQGVLIQVGKAVNDPIKGLTTLRRVGVSFSEGQQNRIKKLVDENKLYQAQQLILGELNKEFAGAAKKYGKGPGADLRRFGDAVEDAQMALATAFLPLIRKVSKAAQEFLSKPEVVQGIKDFGKSVASALSDAVDFLGTIDWDAVMAGLATARDVAKTVVDTFLKLPPWVQTAVITGWGLNKLTGGAVTSIIGQIGAGLIKGVLGMNAGVVNIKAGVVNGAGGPGAGTPAAGGGGSKLAKILGFGAAIFGGVEIGGAIGTALNEKTVAPARNFEQGQVDAVLSSKDAGRIEHAIEVIDDNLHPSDIGKQVALALDINGVRSTLEKQQADLEAQLVALGLTRDEAKKILAAQTRTKTAVDDGNRYAQNLTSEVRGSRSEARAHSQAIKSAVDTGNSYAQSQITATNSVKSAINAKDFSPNVSVTAQFLGQFNISASAVASKVTILSNATRVAHGGSELLQA